MQCGGIATDSTVTKF